MLFNTLEYAGFFAGVFTLSWLLASRPRARVLFLLAASYFFYACWDARFLVLIFGSSTVDYLLAHKIHRTEDPKRRRRWLWLTIALNLGLLGFFKYFHFGVDTARSLASTFGVSLPEVALRVALPVGISFFTFESMSYVIDVYRRELEPRKNYFEYLLFVAFFPHLVAGPIVRPKDLLPQLGGLPRFDASAASEGVFLVVVGLTKKIAIGDYLATNLVDRVFDAPLQYSALETYVATLGYALQIYCDFSGYTDIAIGSALLLGVRFPENFASPYQSASITEFWRRWHISLSTWLRDYLYVPLGGNRRGVVRTYRNLLLTMMLGGLWHGASFTFLAWGTLHGVLLAVERALGLGSPGRARSLVPRIAGVFLTLHLVCLSWIFFRATTFSDAALILSRLGTATTYHPNLSPKLLAVFAAGWALHFVPEAWFEETKRRLIRAPVLVQAAALLAALTLLRRMSSLESVPFVYFQF